MSNRKKPRNRKIVAQSALEKIELPTQDDLEILGQSDAVIDWNDVPASDRTDKEIIGTQIVYQDLTFDVVINDDISEDAKKLIYGGFGGVDHFSIMDPEKN